MTPKPSHYDAAEKIVRSEGAAYALAAQSGIHDRCRAAGEGLRCAIARALADEFARGLAAAQQPPPQAT